MSRDSLPRSKEYKAQKDDGVKRLHPARWERLPLRDPEEWFPKIPIKRDHVYKNMQLSFTGSDGCVADRTLTSMHDRTIPLKLKNFMSENATVASKPQRELKKWDEEGFSTVLDYYWECPNNLTSIQEAYVNYMCVLGNIWPFDETAHTMFRLMFKYRWAGAAENLKTRAAILTDFFEKILRSNARNAANKTCVLSFQQQEKILKDALLKHGVRPDIPLPAQSFPPGSSSSSRSNSQKRAPAQAPMSSRNFQHNGKQACFGFNKGSCNNRAVAAHGGCEDANQRKFVHLCNVWSSQKQDFCRGKHPGSQHK